LDWHNQSSISEEDWVLFTFTETTFTKAKRESNSSVTVFAFTENGKLFEKDTDIVLLEYEFVTPEEVQIEIDDLIQKYPNFELGMGMYAMMQRKESATKGNIVRFTVLGTTLEWTRW
jgi:hypothetical protein